MKNLIYNIYHVITIITLIIVFAVGMILALAVDTPMTEQQPLALLLITKLLGLGLLVISYNKLKSYKLLRLLSK